MRAVIFASAFLTMVLSVYTTVPDVRNQSDPASDKYRVLYFPLTLHRSEPGVVPLTSDYYDISSIVQNLVPKWIDIIKSGEETTEDISDDMRLVVDGKDMRVRLSFNRVAEINGVSFKLSESQYARIRDSVRDVAKEIGR